MLNIFNSDHLREIFPFHILIDHNLEIIQVGNLMRKLVVSPAEHSQLNDTFLVNLNKKNTTASKASLSFAKTRSCIYYR
ncbi:MAG: hypothetical protein HRT71_05640 [Flavobacteriales bacterium]|nr:hypothetical protein [Flavobacteriales bacterium]